MPFIAPMIATALGVGALGELAIGVGLSFALAAASRALAPKEKDQTSVGGEGGARLSLRADPTAPREVILGRAATAGTLVYHNVFGPNGNDTLQLVFALADHECDGLETIYVDGHEVAWNSTTGQVTTITDPAAGGPTTYASKMVIGFTRGTAAQTAFTDLVANSGGRWTSNDRGAGVCYVVVTLQYDPTTFPNGLPSFLFVVRGARLYDWRADSSVGGDGAQRWGEPETYAWTDNPVVALYNWRRGFWLGDQRIAGMNTPAEAMPLADWTSAANICDEAVALAGGDSEPRYAVNGVVSSSSDHREVITDILTAMAGREVDTGGVLRPLPGAAQAVVGEVSDLDLMASAEIEVSSKLSRNKLINAVFGTFNSPDHLYQPIALPPRISPDDEAADGDIRLEQNFALDLVTSGTQGQRILEIFRRRGRHQMEVRCTLRSRWCVLEPGDWVEWTSDRYGFDGIVFEVQSTSRAADLTVEVVLRQVSAGIYDWVPADDELDPTSPATVGTGGPSLDSVSGLSVANIVVEGVDGAERPGLQATWTPITDGTVVGLRLEYRKVGDTVAMELRIHDAGTGQYSWIDGIQGGLTYEVRLQPITMPARAVAWTGWTAPLSATTAFIVDVATIANSVPPDTISAAMLDAQTRFELGLVTAVAAVTGSVAEMNLSSIAAGEQAAEAALDALVNAHGAQAAVRREEIVRQSEDSALAAIIETVSTTVEGHSATIVEFAESIDGIRARWGIVIDIDGNVVGAVQLDGTGAQSAFTVVADKFQVAQPGEDGGDPVQVFTVGEIDGEPAVAIRGDLLADGSIQARALAVVELSAITASLGLITSGRIQNADNSSFIDLDTGEMQLTAA